MVNGNKYLDAFNNVAVECAKEIIQLFKDNNIKVMDFKEGEKGMDYPINIRIIGDDFGEVTEVEVYRLQYKTDGAEPYISILGKDVDGNTLGAYIDEMGGDCYDVEHSIGNIYKAIIDQLNFNDGQRKPDKPTPFYSLTFTKTIWVQRDETDDDQKDKNWEDLDEDTKDSIIDKALEEINCGDAIVSTEDFVAGELVESNMGIDELNS